MPSDKKLVPVIPHVERLEQFVSLEPGRYWRVIKAINDFPVGRVLLLENVRYVDTAPHTVEVLRHPSEVTPGRSRFSSNQFLVADFLAHFEFEPDGEKIRKQELAAVQSKIQHLQENLKEVSQNKNLMDTLVCEKLSACSTARPHQLAIPSLEALSPDSVVVLQETADQLVAQTKAQAEILQEKTKEIIAAIKELAPFFEEKAQASLAKVAEDIKFAQKLQSGCRSLDLYIGNGVDIEQIAEGEGAPYGEHLAVLQRKLMMDEELSLFMDISERFDVSSMALFDKALRENEALADQIFTTKRAVCVMATTRRFLHYSEDARTNSRLNQDNRVVFLLIRNGGNIYRVYSSVESHLGTNRLFPSKDEQDQIFRGRNGESITYDDIRFTDSLDKHESFALHYKRFLLLMAGLDHFKQLFGDFYPRSVNFMSMDFQERYMRFVHDDDGLGLLSDGNRESVRDFLEKNNRHITAGRGGSRIIVDLERLISPKSAPGAYGRERYFQGKMYQDRFFMPETRYGFFSVREMDGRMYIEVPMVRCDTGWYNEHKRQAITVKVFLMGKHGYFYSDGGELPAFLHFDTASLGEVQYHLNNRFSRFYHLEYIRFFKHVEQAMLAREAAYAPIRERAFAVLPEAAKHEDLLFQLFVRYVVASNFDYPTPEQMNEVTAQLLAQLGAHTNPNYHQKVVAFVARKEAAGIRAMGTGGDGTVIVYAYPKDEEKDVRFSDFPWLHKFVLEDSKRGFRVLKHGWTEPPVQNVRELFVDSGTFEPVPDTAIDRYRDHQYRFKSPDHKRKILSIMGGHFDPFSGEAIAKTMKTFLEVRGKASNRRVADCFAVFPVGLLKEKDRLFVLAVTFHCPTSLFMAHVKTDSERKDLKDKYVSLYAHKQEAANRLYSQLECMSKKFSVYRLPVAYFSDRFCDTIAENMPVILPSEDFEEANMTWDKVNSKYSLPQGTSVDAELANFVKLKFFKGKTVDIHWASNGGCRFSPDRSPDTISFDEFFFGELVQNQQVPFPAFIVEESGQKSHVVFDLSFSNKNHYDGFLEHIAHYVRYNREETNGYLPDKRCVHCRHRRDRDGELDLNIRPYGCSKIITSGDEEGSRDAIATAEEIRLFATGEKKCSDFETTGFLESQ